MKWLYERSREPSTWAGVSGVATAVLGVASGNLDLQSGLAVGLPALLAMFAREGARR
jgi:hypothetical protein